MLPWSVIATAGMPRRWASTNRSLSRAAPSSIEYSVCTWRCTNESDTQGPLLSRGRSGPREPSPDPPRAALVTPVLFGEWLDHHSGGAHPRLAGLRLQHAVFDRGAHLERRVVRHHGHGPGAGGEVLGQIVE